MKIRFIISALCASFVLCAGESYNFYMISDTHFGTAESYNQDPATPKRMRTKKDIHRADKAMPLYRAMFADMAKKADKDTRFIVHGGDMIEGLTKGAQVHQEQLENSIKLMQEYFKLPIYVVNGNHDAVGFGGREGYQKGLISYLSKITGKQLQTTNYSVKCGGDLYIFIDRYNKGHFKFIQQTLAEQKSKPRYLFIILHTDDVMPFYTEGQKRYFDLLSPYNAIVLHGHTHTAMMLHADNAGKSVTSFSLGTYLEPQPERNRYNGLDTNLDAPQISRRAKTPERTAYFAKEFRPNLKVYKNFSKSKKGAKFQGYAKISVSDEGIKVMMQSGDLSQEPINFDLRPAK